MHERFAVTLARPHFIESTSPTALFAFCNHTHQPHHSTPPMPHHSSACPPPEVPRLAGMLRRYSPLRTQQRGLRRMAAHIFRVAQVPTVTPVHERILPLYEYSYRHSSHDTCPRPQMPRESRGISPRNGSFFTLSYHGPAKLLLPHPAPGQPHQPSPVRHGDWLARRPIPARPPEGP